MFNRRTYVCVAAWVLLVAYLPLLIGSAVHVHKPHEVLCDDCAHHVEHPSHFAEATVALQDCVACHLVSLIYIGVAAMAVVAHPMAVILHRICRRDSVVVKPCCGAHLRAPPIGE